MCCMISDRHMQWNHTHTHKWKIALMKMNIFHIELFISLLSGNMYREGGEGVA